MKKIFGEITCEYWDEIRRGAKRRGIAFNITPEDAWKLFLFQNKRCAMTGDKLEFTSRRYRGNASFNRIDSNLDYSWVNCNWVNLDVQMMMGAYLPDIFRSVCTKVHLHSHTDDPQVPERLE